MPSPTFRSTALRTSASATQVRRRASSRTATRRLLLQARGAASCHSTPMAAGSPTCTRACTACKPCRRACARCAASHRPRCRGRKSRSAMASAVGSPRPARSSSRTRRNPVAPMGPAMREQLKDQYDVVIVGSGAAGLVGAITAAKLGLSAVIIEKAAVWGGTSSLSGGAVWGTANHLMAEDGEPDTYEEAAGYLKLALHHDGPATSRERQRAFLLGASRMLRMVMDEGVALIREPHQPDYLAHLPHARIGRAVEPSISDGQKLGEDLDTLRRYPGNLPAVRLGELASIGQGLSTLSGIKTMLKVGIRHRAMKLVGKKPLGMGTALVAELMQVVRRFKVPVILNCRLDDVVLKDGGVVGMTCDPAGSGRRTISARSVLLSAGGFAHAAQREELQGTDGRFSLARPDDTGEMLSLARRIGADLEPLDSA